MHASGITCNRQATRILARSLRCQGPQHQTRPLPLLATPSSPSTYRCLTIRTGPALRLGAVATTPPTARTQRRAYSRDPLQAEHEATTVRGNRAARERLEHESRLRFQEQRNSGRSGSGNGDGNEGGKRGSLGSRLSSAWRSTPIRWYPIPVLLGAVVLIGVQARKDYVAEQDGRGVGHRIVDENGQVVRMSGPWTVYVIGALPLNAISRAWGWANNLTLPVWFRPFGFRLYAKIFGCNLDEMKDPDLTHYRSLGEFFYRELKEGARKIDDSILVSPADGTVLHFGEISGRRVEQVKGITYSLDALLGSTSAPQTTEEVDYAQRGDHEKIDEREFASVNGIQYSLDKLLGDEKEKPAEPEKPAKKSALRFLKPSYWRKAKQTSNVTGVPAPEVKEEGEVAPQEHTDPTAQSEEKRVDEAGMPTPDTPEVLGRYANVAYEMGSSALPPLLQPHSPGREGVREGHKLFFCVIYLAPGDYHRFHSPTNWVAERRRHFRGELYSVSPYMAKRLSNLFVLNERVALLGRWRHGFFGMVPVGATNVGSIRINFDKALRTNVRKQRELAGTYSEASYGAASMLLGGQPLAAGDEMGGFLLGSTIVLVFEAPNEFKFELQAGQKVKVGNKLGDVEEAKVLGAEDSDRPKGRDV
ncbi:phosphatidylserine decarboxylase 1 [Thecaphora frezii]|nr:putative phosphatidylserine decarboxylase [Thecaphora frezii]